MSSLYRTRPRLAWSVGLALLAALAVGQGCPEVNCPLCDLSGADGGTDGTGNNGGTDQGQGTVAGVTVRSPSIDQVMAPGSSITMVYDAIGSGLSLSAFYDRDGVNNGNEVTFASGLQVGSNRFIQLPTSNLGAGNYYVGVTVNGSERVYATGMITLVGSMVFTSPLADVSVGPGTQVPVRFNAGVGQTSFTYRTFYDTDCVYNGNEVTFKNGSSSSVTVEDSCDTTGMSTGTYCIGALVSSPGGGVSTAYAPGKLSIVAGAFVQVLAPTIGLVVSPGTQVPVVVSASDPSSSTSTVRIFHDQDTTVNGNETTIGSIPVSGTGLTWNTTGLLPGLYYIGAQLINGFDPPLVSYSAGPVTLVSSGSGGSGGGDGGGIVTNPTLTVTTPQTDTTIFQGKVFRVNWLTNLRAGDGTVRVFREPDIDNNGQPDGVAQRVTIGSEGMDAVTQFVDFNTTGVVGKFFIGATLTFASGDPPMTKYAPGTLTIQPLVFWAGNLGTKRNTSGAVIPQTGAFRGSVFRGFNFQDNLGSAMIAADDFNDDDRNEIVLAAQFAKPLLFAQQGRGAGEGYMIYGQSQRYSGDYDVNTVGSSRLPGLAFTGIFPNPRPGTDSDIRAKSGNITPYTVEGQPTAEFATEGLRSLTMIPDQDGDGKRELVFGFPWCNSYSLHNRMMDELHPVPVNGLGRLENNGHFLRGGVVIVSSRNSLLMDSAAVSRHLDRVMDLQEVGQWFSHMVMPWTAPYDISTICSGCGDGDPDIAFFPTEGFDQIQYIDPPRLASPEPAWGMQIAFGVEFSVNAVDAPCDLAGALIFGGRRFPSCTQDGNDAKGRAAYGSAPPYGIARVLQTGFYYSDLPVNSSCPNGDLGENDHDPYCGVRQIAQPREPYGCRILGQTTTQPLLGTTANRFGNSVSVSGDFLLIGAPRRTVRRRDVPLLPETNRADCGVVYMLTLNRVPNSEYFFWSLPTDLGLDPPTPGAHRDLPAPYNYIIRDVGYNTCHAWQTTPGPGHEMATPTHIVGASPGDRIGEVTGLHDINNDGVDDVAVGGAGTNGSRGAVYIIYRRQPQLEGDYLLERLQLDPADVNRLNGLMILGETGENLGTAVAGRGALNDDYNNDGYADLLIGSPNATPASGFHAGQAFVLFGGRNVVNPLGGISTANLVAGGNGMLLTGVRAGDAAGTTVANAGDVNGDGVADLMISAPEASPRFIAAGGSEQIGIDLNGDGVADDLNVDGYPDDMTGAGIVYIVFGGSHLTGTINLSQIGTDNLPGFTIVGRKAGDHMGGGVTQGGLLARGVSAAGDVDADGRADLLVGSILADPEGKTNAGEVYLIYGFKP